MKGIDIHDEYTDFSKDSTQLEFRKYFTPWTLILDEPGNS